LAVVVVLWDLVPRKQAVPVEEQVIPLLLEVLQISRLQQVEQGMQTSVERLQLLLDITDLVAVAQAAQVDQTMITLLEAQVYLLL
jgi:hypothetical protein